MTRIGEVTGELERIAPRQYQEDYDNSGLLVGNALEEVRGVLVSLDVTEAVVAEAEKLDCNLIIAHHPLIFKGLKSVTDSHWIGRVVRRAVKSDISIYAIHTNLDNVLRSGVNGKIAERLNLVNIRPLSARRGMLGFSILTPELLADNVRKSLMAIEPTSLFENAIDYTLPNEGAKISRKFEGVVLPHQQRNLASMAAELGLNASFWNTSNSHPDLGSGLVGEFEMPVVEDTFLEKLKSQMKTPVIRHTKLQGKSITKVAVCGGAGSFLLKSAIGAGAEAFVTADFKYHDFFEADDKIVVADIGHYESEQFTIDLLFDTIRNKFSTFALHCTKVNTNPVNYF